MVKIKEAHISKSVLPFGTIREGFLEIEGLEGGNPLGFLTVFPQVWCFIISKAS